MSTKNVLKISFFALLMLVFSAYLVGCGEVSNESQNQVPEQSQSLVGPQFPDTLKLEGEYPYGEFVGLSADSINALARWAKQTDQRDGKQVKTLLAAGWQLYVPVPFYSQKDPSWSGKRLGFGWCGTTIGSHGCYLSCVSMLYAKWGYYNMNPGALNDWMHSGREHYAFSNSGCGDLLRIYEAIQYPGMCRNVRYISAGQIYHELQMGHPVIIEVWTGSYRHFMVVFAFDGSVFWVKDPLKNAATQDRPLYGWFRSAVVLGY